MNKHIKKLIESVFDDDIFNNDDGLNDIQVSEHLCKYHPKNKFELKSIINLYIIQNGYDCDLNDIDVSRITDMSYLFSNMYFNGDISLWDVSNVTDMKCMFESAYFFNGDISNWNVSKVENMQSMFEYSKFNGDISKWDVSSVTNMSRMFYKSKWFNKDISDWNVSNVTDMDSMFWGSNFNKDISKWVLSKDVNTDYMFYDCPLYKLSEKLCHKPILESVFDDDIFNDDNDIQSDIEVDKHINQYSCRPENKLLLYDIINNRIKEDGYECNLNDIDVSLIEDMSYLFNASKFNGDISLWNVSNVTRMTAMFLSSKFNGDISLWNVSNVTEMSRMFFWADFDGDISNWKLNPKCDIEEIFKYGQLENKPEKLCKK